jgi:clan AA aspartic protease
MIVGTVLPTGEVVIQLPVRGTNGEIARVHMMVDTGFNDYLALPSWVIERLAMPVGDDAQFLLADGEKRRSRTFIAEVEWFGQWRRVIAVEIDGDPLLGVMMMDGHHLGIDVVAGGRVEIRALT